MLPPARAAAFAYLSAISTIKPSMTPIDDCELDPEVVDEMNALLNQVETSATAASANVAINTIPPSTAPFISAIEDWKNPNLWLLLLQAMSKHKAHLSSNVPWAMLLGELGVPHHCQHGMAISASRRFLTYKKQMILRYRDMNGVMQLYPNVGADACERTMHQMLLEAYPPAVVDDTAPVDKTASTAISMAFAQMPRKQLWQNIAFLKTFLEIVRKHSAHKRHTKMDGVAANAEEKWRRVAAELSNTPPFCQVVLTGQTLSSRFVGLCTAVAAKYSHPDSTVLALAPLQEGCGAVEALLYRMIVEAGEQFMTKLKVQVSMKAEEASFCTQVGDQKQLPSASKPLAAAAKPQASNVAPPPTAARSEAVATSPRAVQPTGDASTTAHTTPVHAASADHTRVAEKCVDVAPMQEEREKTPFRSPQSSGLPTSAATDAAQLVHAEDLSEGHARDKGVPLRSLRVTRAAPDYLPRALKHALSDVLEELPSCVDDQQGLKIASKKLRIVDKVSELTMLCQLEETKQERLAAGVDRLHSKASLQQGKLDVMAAKLRVSKRKGQDDGCVPL